MDKLKAALRREKEVNREKDANKLKEMLVDNEKQKAIK